MRHPLAENLSVGVDIGGTFTDFVGAQGGRVILTGKVPSTPSDPAAAVLSGLRRLLEAQEIEPSAISRFAHGTTVATNAALERKGARLGLLTTKGFEDALEIGRLGRSDIYGFSLKQETPAFVAPRRARLGIDERLGPEGEVIRPLDEGEVAEAARELVEHHSVEALAVCYLFSFKNPDHELKTREVIRNLFPKMPVSISCEVDPRFREYERLCTTIFDAYLGPATARYLRRLGDGLKHAGVKGRFFVMRSGGGLADAHSVVERPVSLLKSGLAAGVAGAAQVAREAGRQDVVTVDIGGTSCDVALVRGGKPEVREQSLLRTYPIRVPMVDVNTIGAGGGSIAWLDAADGLHVGPRSAGADPGPACYGIGGQEPTVTDASVVLGYLNPSYFAGGSLALDPEGAHHALRDTADRLELSVPETAYGIHRIVNASMANEIRKISLRRGHDVRRFALIALGGAGPVHACELARELGMETVIVPARPGLLSAHGLLASSVTHDQVQAFQAPLRDVDPRELLQRCREMDEAGRAVLRQGGAPENQIVVEYFLQMRYVGQAYELTVVMPVLDGEVISLKVIAETFHQRHEAVHGRRNSDAAIEIVEIKATHAWPQAGPSGADAAEPYGPPNSKRPVYSPERGEYEEVAVYRRSAIPAEVLLEGPMIVEQADTTTVVGAGQRVRADGIGNLIIELGTVA